MDKSRNKEIRTRELVTDQRLLIIFSITLSATMGVSLVTPVMPRLMDVFSISREEVVLLVTAFTLPGVFVAPFYGIFADRFGRKQVLIPALLLFGLAGSGCGLAGDFTTLLVLRFLQGTGGAALFTLNNTLIGDIFEGKTRYQAMGLNASVISLSAAMYPAFGGFLGDIRWNLPFFVPFFAIIVGVIVAFGLHSPEPERMRSVKDYLKAASHTFRQWNILKLFILTFITFLLTFGPIISFVPLWMAEEYSSSASTIGMVLSSASLTAGLFSARLGWFREKFNVQSIVFVSFVLYAFALVLIPVIGAQWFMLIPALILGTAQGLNLPTVQTIIISAAPMQLRGAFMAINSTIILSGITLAPVLAALAFKTLGIKNLYYLTGSLAMVMAFLIYRYGQDLEK